MKPDKSPPGAVPSDQPALESGQVPAAVRREARGALSAIVGLANRLAEPGLPDTDRTLAASAIRKYCRRILRLLTGADVDPPPAEKAAATPRPRVLVAEDCTDSRQAVQSFLTRCGLDVTLAENGRVAVTMAREQRFDLVLLDMQMPEVDGYEAARQLRSDGFRGPVIALTGDVEPGDEQACHEAGCDAYLAKPWDPDQLVRVLQAYIRFEGTRRTAAGAPVGRPVEKAAEPTYQELAFDFLRGLPRTVSEMVSALESGNRVELERLAHRVSGAAGLFRFSVVAQAARRLEAAAKDRAEGDDALARQIQALADLIRKHAPDPPPRP